MSEEGWHRSRVKRPGAQVQELVQGEEQAQVPLSLRPAMALA
jgi:hypothetical protein